MSVRYIGKIELPPIKTKEALAKQRDFVENKSTSRCCTCGDVLYTSECSRCIDNYNY